MTTEIPKSKTNKEDITKLVALTTNKTLAVEDKINIMLSEVVANEVVFRLGEDYFETLRYAVNGVPLKLVHEFLYNQEGCKLQDSHQRGTRDYHKYIPMEARRKHA